MLEHFHAGDRIRASQFNRLVDALCNLRRKVDSLKRGGVHPNLRVNQVVRYRGGRSTGTEVTEPVGPQTDYDWKVREAAFPVWRPPFAMHWKMTWVPTSTEIKEELLCQENLCLTCGEWRYCKEGIIINPGSWFVGSQVLMFPCRVIQHGQIMTGTYWLERDTGCVIVGEMTFGPKRPGQWWPLGEVCANKCSCYCYRISKSWNGDIWEEPSTWATLGSRRDPIAAELIFDFARMASGCVYETCTGVTVQHQCKFVPHNGQAKFAGLGLGERYYFPSCGAMMIAGYTSKAAEVEWWTGEKPIAITGSTIDETDPPGGYQPKLCVSLRGRDCQKLQDCFGFLGPYRGSPVWVCHRRSVGYRFCTAEPEEFEVYGKILGVGQVEEYSGNVQTLIWPKAGFVSANTINSLWTSTNSRRISEGQTAEMQQPIGLTVRARLSINVTFPNYARWCLHQYIGHTYGIPKSRSLDC